MIGQPHYYPLVRKHGDGEIWGLVEDRYPGETAWTRDAIELGEFETIGAAHKALHATMSDPLRLAAALVPELTIEGYGIQYRRGGGWKEQGLSYAEAFARERARLFDPNERRSFDRACAWLSGRRRTKRPNCRAPTSYGLKHIFEHDEAGGGCYVPNGIFIAACVVCGFPLEPVTQCDGPNPYVGIALASLPNRQTV